MARCCRKAKRFLAPARWPRQNVGHGEAHGEPNPMTDPNGAAIFLVCHGSHLYIAPIFMLALIYQHQPDPSYGYIIINIPVLSQYHPYKTIKQPRRHSSIPESSRWPRWWSSSSSIHLEYPQVPRMPRPADHLPFWSLKWYAKFCTLCSNNDPNGSDRFWKCSFLSRCQTCFFHSLPWPSIAFHIFPVF